jgi:predicted ATPase/DNA-binding CsgD family transcriptional regulator
VTRREAEVLELIMDHRTNAEIAAELHLSIRTVESHVRSLLRKSGADDRRGLARTAEADTRGEPGSLGVRSWPTSFVGRDDLLDSLPGLMSPGRLLTLVGPGGVGKTRLVHELLARVEAGSWGRQQVVELLPIGPGRVAAAVAGALGVSEQPGVPLHDTVVAAIGQRRMVLVLDNAEHLVAEVADLAARVASRCPYTVVMVTSREALRVAGEEVIVLPPLTGTRRDEAVRLFCDRAKVDRDDLVLSVVDGLGGIPLSLELAAARVRALGIAGVHEAMARPLSLLAGGRGEDHRHHSARATVAWSYDLLTEDEGRLLRALAHLSHAVDLPTAARLNGATEAETAVVLAGLTEKSLLQVDQEQDTHRWIMLQTVREYVRETTAYAVERDDAEVRLRDWAGDRAARALAIPRDESAHLLADLVSIVHRGPDRTDAAAHRLAVRVGRLCIRHGWLRDAVECYGAAAARAATTRDAVQSLLDAASIANARSAGDLALGLTLRAAERARTGGDPTGRARALLTAVISAYRYPPSPAAAATMPDPPLLLDQAQHAVADPDPHTWALLAAARAWHGGGLSRAETALAAAEAAAEPTLIAGALDVVIGAYGAQHQLRRAREAAERRLALLRTIPHDTPAALEEVIDARHIAGGTALVIGRLDDAEHIDLRAPFGIVHNTMEDLPRRIRVLTLRGAFTEAVDQADLLWTQWTSSGYPPLPWMATAAATAVLACGMTGSPREGEWRSRMLTLANTEVADHIPVLAAIAAYVDARLALHRADLSDAARLVARCNEAFADRWYEGFARSAGAELALVAGLPHAHSGVERLAPYAEESDWVAAVQLRCQARVMPDASYREQAIALWTTIGAEAERAATLAL